MKESVQWIKSQTISSWAFCCGVCGNQVASSEGFFAVPVGVSFSGFPASYAERRIYICPHCQYPSCFDRHTQCIYPRPLPGRSVGRLPDKIDALFTEARKCFQVGAYTSVLMVSRKLLMHISVDLGAQPKSTFQEFVAYLDKENYIPKNSKSWVDKLRKHGNEQNHEIKLATEAEAIEILNLTEMLLRLLYEFRDSSAQTASL